MRTPAGQECKYFYGDYYRGRNFEECRLLGKNTSGGEWSTELCFTCSVPGILRDNACEHMELHGEIRRPFPFIKRIVSVTATCSKCRCNVPEPHIGCGECHNLPEIFTGALDDSNPSG